MDKVKIYIEKVESQTEKLVLCMEGKDDEEIDGVISADCDLCYFAMDIYLELKQFKEKLLQEKESAKEVKTEIQEYARVDQLVHLQRDMQQLLSTQLQQSKTRTRQVGHTSEMKLPKMELPAFNGNKAKWIEF